jgi:hypothetical protein
VALKKASRQDSQAVMPHAHGESSLTGVRRPDRRLLRLVRIESARSPTAVSGAI